MKLKRVIFCENTVEPPYKLSQNDQDQKKSHEVLLLLFRRNVP